MVISYINPFRTNGISHRATNNEVKMIQCMYEEAQIIICKRKNAVLSLNINFILAKSTDPDEMPHCAAFHLGLHCLS